MKADKLKAGLVFTDLDQSGAKASRPQFDEMMARIEKGESGGVIVHDLSRFGRSTRNVLDGIDAIEAKGAVFISCDEKLDTATSMGRFVLTVLAALRQLELDQSRDRWAVSKAGARERGIHIGAARAGYVRTAEGHLKEHPEFMPIVKQVFALRAQGGAWSEVVALLTDGGVPTSKSKGLPAVWSRQGARAMVRTRAYRTDEGGPIPNWQWEKAQPAEGEPRVRGEGFALGGGLVRCATCGGGMHRSSNGARVQLLRCDTPGKGHATMKYNVAEHYIVSLAFSHIGMVSKREPGGDPEKREELENAVEEARFEFGAAEKMLGMVPPAESVPATALRLAEDALQEFEAESAKPIGVYDLLTPVGQHEEFDKLPIPERRRLLRKIISRVVLAPGRGKPGDRLVVEFTDGERWPDPKGFVPAGTSLEELKKMAALSLGVEVGAP